MENNQKTYLNTNRIDIIGTLVNVESEIKTSNNSGKNFITGKVSIKSIIEGAEQVTELEFISFETKSDGTPNKLFETYSKLDTLLNKRVAASGEINENRFYAESQTISHNRLRLGFISLARANQDKDLATFEYGGFVVKPLSERLDAQGNLIGYEITLMQTDFSGKPRVGKLFVDPSQSAAISFMTSNYESGVTVKVVGGVVYKTETTTKEVEMGFGDSVVKQYTNTIRSFVIKSGTQPVIGVGEYDHAAVNKLVEEYKATGLQIAEDAKNRESGTTTGFSQQKQSPMTSANPAPKAKANFGGLL